MIKYNHILVIIAFLGAYGCRSYYYNEMAFEQKNATEYVFNFPPDQIKLAIKTHKKTLKHAFVMYADDKEIAWGDSVLKLDGNQNDVYIRYYDMDSSYVYVNRYYPIMYHAEYHIHLLALNKCSTLVKIFTYNSRILISDPILPTIFHTPAKSRSVPPSTIEEYKLLLWIGEALGVKESMPKLLLPLYPSSDYSKYIPK